MSGQTLEAIKFDETKVSLSILDQLLIPYQTVYLDVRSIDDGFQVIKKMQVRGAPAIAIVGCFSIVVELNRALKKDPLFASYDLADYTKFVEYLISRIDYLITSRPTAVNLLNGCNDIKRIIKDSETNISQLYQSIKSYSIKLFKDDLINNFKIGENGCNYIFEDLSLQNFKGEFSVMTICNTGSLATSGHGTALGIIRSLWLKSKLNDSCEDKSQDSWLSHVYACETRPYNQGSRLTSYELNYEKIPFSLITDNMVSFLVESLTNNPDSPNNQLPNKAPIKYIIVGADRIVSNGDLANKIGTFQLSLISSNYPLVKFIGAAPRTTIDLNMKSGSEIVIEQRPGIELTTLKGGELKENNEFVTDSNSNVKLTKIQVATPGIGVWNPAFDVTPHRLIDCIVTEDDYLLKDSKGEFHLD